MQEGWLRYPGRIAGSTVEIFNWVVLHLILHRTTRRIPVSPPARLPLTSAMGNYICKRHADRSRTCKSVARESNLTICSGHVHLRCAASFSPRISLLWVGNGKAINLSFMGKISEHNHLVGTSVLFLARTDYAGKGISRSSHLH
jgi:hypothetical protein